MGNLKSGPLQSNTKPRYEVVLPTWKHSWEVLFAGDIETWDAVAENYGMDKFAYTCGVANCERESVCIRYVRATYKANQGYYIQVERYKRSTIQVPFSKCKRLKDMLIAGFTLNEVAAAQRGRLLLLVLNKLEDYSTRVAFVLVSLKDEEGEENAIGRQEARSRLMRRGSSRKERAERGSVTGSQQNSCHEPAQQNSEGSCVVFENVTKCLGVLESPHKDMTVISCQISPDLSQTAILYYSMSSTLRCFCYDLHIYSNKSLLSSQETTKAEKNGAKELSCDGSRTDKWHSSLHIQRIVTLNREVQPYFVYDPRYRCSRVAVANFESRLKGIAHELVVLSFEDDQEATVVQRGKLSLPSLFGTSRFNLLYSKNGQLIIMQKLTDDRFGVTSFCDIYIFNSDGLQLMKYLTASLPGLFHICKVNYEPVFSRCGSFMRVMDHRVRDGRRDESEECTVVQIYQLPRMLCLMSQCRVVILQQLSACCHIAALPIPSKLKDYLRFKPIY